MADLVRVKDKFQITLPASIRRQLAVQEGDYLDVVILDDSIVFRPQQTVKRAARPPNLMSFLNERRSSTRTRAEIDATLAKDRASWKK